MCYGQNNETRLNDMNMQQNWTIITSRMAKVYDKDGVLFRYYASSIFSIKQLVVPVKFRIQVLQTVNDSMFAGHLDHVETLARIQSQFHWPGIVKDVKDYVKSCNICQKIL